MKIGIIDYGMGNIFSVRKSLLRLGVDVAVVQTTNDLINCQALILPGVGSFDPAINSLKNTGLIPNLIDFISTGKPFLGICLGLQLLFEKSEEGKCHGLGLIKGNVIKLPISENERIPHMGWSKLNVYKDNPLLNSKENSNWMYFVHSYSAVLENKDNLIATTNYGSNQLTAIVQLENAIACQFHPEKSGLTGLMFLENWKKWIEKEF